MAKRPDLHTGHPPRDRQMGSLSRGPMRPPDPRLQTPPNIGDCPHHPDPPPDLPSRNSIPER